MYIIVRDVRFSGHLSGKIRRKKVIYYSKLLKKNAVTLGSSSLGIAKILNTRYPVLFPAFPQNPLNLKREYAMRLLRPFLYFAFTASCLAHLPLPLLPLPPLEAARELTDSPHIHRIETPIRQALVAIPQIEPQSGLNGVDCLYVINLKKRPEKWQRTQQLCAEYGLLPSRVNAVDGTTLSKKNIKALCGKYPLRMKLGQIGCFLSHVSIFVDSYQRQFNCIWVCEDDMEFLDDPLQMPELIKELTEIDPNWDILYTDANSTVPACYGWPVAPGTALPNLSMDFRPDQYHFPIRYYLARQKVGEHFTRIGQRYGLYSYFISKKGLQKLVNYFLHVYLWSPIDIDIHYVPYIRQYVLNTPVVSHWIDSGTHDTDTDNKKNQVERW